MILFGLLFSLAALPAARGFAQLSPQEKAAAVASFELVWSTVREHHPDPRMNGLDWQAVHDATAPAIARAQSMDDVRAALTSMLAQLGASHYAIIPAGLYRPVAPSGQPLSGAASPGLTTVLIDGKAVVGSVTPDSAAERAGVRPGMVLEAVGDTRVGPLLEKAAGLPGEPARREARRLVERSVTRQLAGEADTPVRLQVVDGDGVVRHLEVPREETAGKRVTFGNLPEQRVVFEARALASGAGYIRFNEFLDPASLMPKFEAAVKRFGHAPGIILDLRGNPGGIGIMAMGIAGFFIERTGQKLGEMKMRETTLKFVVFPRPDVYSGKLAILVDGGSASTTEILAQGLRDLERARIFGTRTAGAALPSDIIRLPDGDGFQYAQASYVSEKGRVLEGNGVVPDVEVSQTEDALRAGRDLVVPAAEAWITAAQRVP